MVNLFKDIIPTDKQSRNYKLIRDDIGHKPSRIILNEIYNSFKPIDKNFVQEFQSGGFDSRIWELYLAATFQEQQFYIEGKHDRPDFELSKGDIKIFVEAVTSNPSFNQTIESKMDILNRTTAQELIKILSDLVEESTIKTAGALCSKLNKEYWNLDWVKGYPIIIAVESFHHSLSHLISDSYLINYLYGIQHLWKYNKSGKLNITESQIFEHTAKNKSIPSNFFGLPNSENISAVIFSNSGTISKFNRIGELQGYGNNRIKIVRRGINYDHDPNSSTPVDFAHVVGERGSDENWSQGISMYHNPKAKYPIDVNLFPNILHGHYNSGFYASIPKFFPLSSHTEIYIPADLR